MKNRDSKFLIKVTSVGATGMLPGGFKPQWVSKESPSFGFASLFFIFSEIEGSRATKSGKSQNVAKSWIKNLQNHWKFRKFREIRKFRVIFS